ncbi:hypothetical protein P12053L_25 [Celeribacter phage P12053L]|uniref:Uncharacterized protein n=1 Tax=Celeribacter phage P12053L TaxID=1197951 RepID=I6S6I0_9CAUD|nr:hypothetical protein B622_gp25 [Celeribacter phage P12053L]AFM54630.1 hypothetical protein P12053L_25 [Celeribacter phage P12053L]
MEGLSLPLHSTTDKGVILFDGNSLRCYLYDDVEEDLKEDVLPEDAAARKNIPVYSGFIKYFPDAIVAISQLSLVGGIQHGQTRETLHWDRSKSTDHKDALMRHLIEEDWTAVAWRAMAQLQKSIEDERK